MSLLYILPKNFLNKFAYFYKIYYDTKYHDHALSIINFIIPRCLYGCYVGIVYGIKLENVQKEFSLLLFLWA
jgi:hypothetical protein